MKRNDEFEKAVENVAFIVISIVFLSLWVVVGDSL